MSVNLNMGAVKSDIDQFVRLYADSIYERAKKEVPEMAKTELQKYYEYPVGSSYIRTGNFLDNSYVPWAYKTGSKYFAGVRFDSSYMDNYRKHGVSIDQIHTWNLMGMHGFEQKVWDRIPKYGYSPWYGLVKRVNGIYSSELVSYGEHYAVANGHYIALQFSIN